MKLGRRKKMSCSKFGKHLKQHKINNRYRKVEEFMGAAGKKARGENGEKDASFSFYTIQKTWKEAKH